MWRPRRTKRPQVEVVGWFLRPAPDCPLLRLHHLRHQLHSHQPRLLVEAAVRAGQLKKFGELSMISIGQEELNPIQRFHKMNRCIGGFQRMAYNSNRFKRS